ATVNPRALKENAREGPMQIVEVRPSGDALAGRMAEMRDWLDARRIAPKLFKMGVHSNSVVFRLEFATADDAADGAQGRCPVPNPVATTAVPAKAGTHPSDAPTLPDATTPAPVTPDASSLSQSRRKPGPTCQPFVHFATAF